VRHIRTVIFDVESTRASIGTLRRRVLDVAREAARPLGFQPRVIFDGPVELEIVGPVADDLVATLREALSNVARHAAAQSVDVGVRATADRIDLRVADDGRGIGADADTGGRGLTNMRTRAERHGGTFVLASNATGGTVVEWAVPARD